MLHAVGYYPVSSAPEANAALRMDPQPWLDADQAPGPYLEDLEALIGLRQLRQSSTTLNVHGQLETRHHACMD